MEGFGTGIMLVENHTLDKPRRLPKIPCRRADVRHGLNDVILDAKKLAQILAGFFGSFDSRPAA